ncbi:MAG: peptidylprolyl isomerase [Burkholderiaceae bacterium]|nr:peptidylprolyl isomerase [Burkholderiaceae bacterium]
MITANPTVLINTSYGPLTIELYQATTPITVSNYLSYVDENYYDGTIFHRVIDNFMIQGGGLSQSITSKPTHAPIKLETNVGLSNLSGTIAMARTSAADSATSQFFINTVDNRFLDYQSASSPGYAVFGKVIDGMDVATAISTTAVKSVTVSGVPYQNFPYPYLIPIYSVDRYVQSASPLPTTHTLKTNDYGVSIATYAGNRLEYGVKINADKTLTVTKIDGQHLSETVTDARRVAFADSKFAYDLDGNAGKTALLINAAFGPEYIKSVYIGTVMGLFDQGMTLDKIAGLATPIMHSLAGNSDNATFFKTIYKNLVGSLPDAGTLATFQGILDRGEMTQSTMLTAATTLELNETAINLVGISHSGLGFV